MAGQSDDTQRGVEEVTPFAQPSRHPSASADVGDAVAGVLRAAEEAAAKIRGDAQTQAREIVERAHGEASARIEELTRESERTRTDAEDYARDIRVAVDGYGRNSAGTGGSRSAFGSRASRALRALRGRPRHGGRRRARESVVAVVGGRDDEASSSRSARESSDGPNMIAR